MEEGVQRTCLWASSSVALDFSHSLSRVASISFLWGRQGLSEVRVGTARGRKGGDRDGSKHWTTRRIPI